MEKSMNSGSDVSKIYWSRALVVSISAFVLTLLIMYWRIPTSFSPEHMWATGGDAMGHYLSFSRYVSSPPHPKSAGWLDWELYPVGTSTVYLDAMPIYAWTVRTFAPQNWFPNNPEFWMTLHVSLGFPLAAGAMALLIGIIVGRRFSIFPTIGFSLAYAFWPHHVSRATGHLALSLMYIIVLSLVFNILWFHKRYFVVASIALLIISIWSAGLHPYFPYMNLMVLGSSTVFWFIYQLMTRSRSSVQENGGARLFINEVVRRVGVIGVLATSAVLVWYLFGGYPVPFMTGGRGHTFHYHSKPFALLIDGENSVLSRLIPSLASQAPTWEGYAFVGTLVAGFGFYWLINQVRSLKNAVALENLYNRKLALASVIVGVFFAYFCSWSSRAFGELAPIFSPTEWMAALSSSFDSFRSLGRLSWPMVIMTFAGASIWCQSREKWFARFSYTLLILGVLLWEQGFMRHFLANYQLRHTFLVENKMPKDIRQIAKLINQSPDKQDIKAMSFYPFSAGYGGLKDCFVEYDSTLLKQQFQLSYLTDLPISTGWTSVIGDEDCRELGRLWRRELPERAIENPVAPSHIVVFHKNRLKDGSLNVLKAKFRHRYIGESKSLIAFRSGADSDGSAK